MKCCYTILFFINLLLLQSCTSIINESNNVENDNIVVSEKTTTTTSTTITNNTITTTTTTIISETKKTPSIIGKWYYNPDDDRYYYEFLSNGTLRYSYYRNYSSSFSVSPYFMILGGTWKYLNDEKNKFSVGWRDTLNCWYDIISEDDEKIVLRKDNSESAPVGPGLWSGHTVLLKSAKTVIYTVDEEIKDLIGIWYYDKTMDGQYIDFRIDKTFYCRYYQYFGSGSLVSHLNHWVIGKGKWHYNRESKLIAITVDSELTYNYEIVNLTSKNLTLKLAEKNPSGLSLYIKINNDDKRLYRK